MKYAIFMLIAALSACSNENSENDISGSFSPQENIDVSDIEGLWVNSCLPSQELENIYYRQFLDYKSGYIAESQNLISFGNQYFSDANCTQQPEPNSNLVDVVYIPSFDSDSIDFNPIGIYTNTDGIIAKVVEFSSETNGSTHLAYYINNDALYLSFSNGLNYQFDYSDTYRLAQ
tara:strand:+ start:685 stop:1209 length:525 start_codon:yes stop_codon:yes gene_type:complete